MCLALFSSFGMTVFAAVTRVSLVSGGARNGAHTNALWLLYHKNGTKA
jgi:hypothetical protein